MARALRGRAALLLACLLAGLARAFRAPGLARGAPVWQSLAPARRRTAPALVVELIADPAALGDALNYVPVEHSEGSFFWTSLLLVISGMYASVRNGPAIEAKRYADAQKRGTRRARQPALPPVRRRRSEAVAPRGRGRGSTAEDELLDTFRW